MYSYLKKQYGSVGCKLHVVASICVISHDLTKFAIYGQRLAIFSRFGSFQNP